MRIWELIERVYPLPQSATMTLGGQPMTIDLADETTSMNIYRGFYERAELMIDGDSYVIRDKQGNELTFRIDRSTAMEGLIHMGAKVAADVEADGRVSRLQLVK